TNAVYRNNMLYGIHSAYRPAGGPNHMGVHCFSEDGLTGATQDGLFEGSGSYSYFSPSLAVSPSDDLLLAYNGSSANSYPAGGISFRYGGQPSFLPYIMPLPGTAPSLAIRNGINFGATTSAISPLQAPDEGLYRFLSKLLTQTCQGSNIYLTDVFSPRSPFLQ